MLDDDDDDEPDFHVLSSWFSVMNWVPFCSEAHKEI